MRAYERIMRVKVFGAFLRVFGEVKIFDFPSTGPNSSFWNGLLGIFRFSNKHEIDILDPTWCELASFLLRFKNKCIWDELKKILEKLAYFWKNTENSELLEKVLTRRMRKMVN